MSTPTRNPSRPTAEVPMTIGQVSRLLGLHPQALRRMERAGFLPEARRSLLQWRYWLACDIAGLRLRASTYKEQKKEQAR